MNDDVGGKIEGAKVVCGGGNSGTDCGASDCWGNGWIGCGNWFTGGNTCAYTLAAPRPLLIIDNETKTKTNGKGKAIFLII
jgi:hypothetical protein